MYLYHIHPQFLQDHSSCLYPLNFLSSFYPNEVQVVLPKYSKVWMILGAWATYQASLLKKN